MERLDFKTFFENIAGGSMVPTGFSNSDSDVSNYAGRVQLLPGTDFAMGSSGIELKYVDKEGLVTFFDDKKNTMRIVIQDKNKKLHTIYATPSQVSNFQGDLPIVPKNSYIKVKYLRNPLDKSDNVSSIASCVVKFIGNSGIKNQYNVQKNSKSYMFPPI
jgi:hypothetical protein